ncbi:MAG: mechanosensitive ion channel, partial [Candidatus Brocadiia bacterium]
YYTAKQLFACLLDTILLVFGVTIFSAVMVRWLTVTQNRLLLKKHNQRVASSPVENKNEASVIPPEQDIDPYRMSLQTRRLIRAFMVLAMIVGIWLIWNQMLPALRIFNRIELWKTTVADITVSITLTNLALAIIIILMTVVAARNILGLLEIMILQRLPFDRGVRFAVVTLTRYVIVIIGAILAFGEIGIGWSKVQWLVAAITVGLGFGLQEIFANFISGLIMLFEQPMRVGDIVTVGDISGKVTRIRIRATTIQKWDRKELVVPNKEFITGRLINWTLTDTVLRMAFNVGIAYGSDTALTEKVLLQVARENPKVLRDPPPIVIFKAFGSSALEFELRLYIPDLDSYLEIWHQVNCAIDAAFRKAGIEIAFPQQDIHVRSIQYPIPVDMKKDGGK